MNKKGLWPFHPEQARLKAEERLKILLGQALETVSELAQEKNLRDRGSRIRELSAYLRLILEQVERMENEHFRINPDLALTRAKILSEGSRSSENIENQ